jgi:hypothetical protein
MFYYVYLLGPVIDKIADQIRPACILFIRKAFSEKKNYCRSVCGFKFEEWRSPNVVC